MKVSDINIDHDNLFILHGISKKGSENFVQEGATLTDQIRFCIASSTVKLSAFSFVFRKHKSSNMYIDLGIIIKDADIFDVPRQES